MTGSQDDSEVFVKTLSDLILKSTRDWLIRIEISTLKESGLGDRISALKEYLGNNVCSLGSNPHGFDVRIRLKERSEKVLNHLWEDDWPYSLDYSFLPLHPGRVLANNVSPTVSVEELRQEINKHCDHHSLLGIQFVQGSSSVRLEFDDFIDADRIESQNIYSCLASDKNLPITFQKFISLDPIASEPTLLEATAPDSSCSSELSTTSTDRQLDSVVIENADELFSTPVSMDNLNTLLLKFSFFGEIDSICFPVTRTSGERFELDKTAFIGFSSSNKSPVKVLECLYFLNDLSSEELFDFTETSIDLSSVLVNPESSATSKSHIPRIKLALVQKKHGGQIYRNLMSDYIRLGSRNVPELVPHEAEIDSERTSKLLARFLKPNNYQETNVYVNNLPLLFQNNDHLWSQFWSQFGFDGINSAKIIKPQFYTKKHTETVGKIGFVFYKEFKMALRAIIMTNNKEIQYPGMAPVFIETSFAIQKKNCTWSKFSQSRSSYPGTSSREISTGLPYQQRTASKRASLPVLNNSDFSSYVLMGHEPLHSYMVPPFDPFIFNPYYLQMPPYAVETELDDLGTLPSSPSPLSSPRSHPGQSVVPTGMNGAFPPQFGYMMPFYPYPSLYPMGGRSPSFDGP